MALLGNLTGSAPFFQDAGSFYNNAILTSYRNDNASDAYLYGNKGGNGDRQTFTISWWMKIGTSLTGTIYTSGFSGSGASASSGHIITSSNKVRMQNQVNNSAEWTLDSTRLFRDASAWYNCVLAVDTTQGTEANRIKLYVNGVQETLSGSYPSQNANLRMNNQYEKIGTWDDGGNRYFDFDGYFADFNLIDGTQLDASSFGEFKNGVWIPVDTSSLTRGTKGWRLQFKQVGVGTASSSTVGADTGGNDFHFTSSGIVASDCAMPDSPENNFATLNPNARGTTNVSLSEGNLKFVKSGSNFGNVLSTMPLFSGKWYFEGVCLNSNLAQIGVQEITNNIYQNSGDFGANTDLGMWDSRGYFYDEGTAGGTPPSYTTGDIIGIAFDVEAGKIWFAKNGTYLFSGDPANGTNQSTGSTNNLSSIGVTPAGNGEGGGGHTFNFGQDSSFVGAKTAQGNTDENGIGDFYYSPPSGFLALCSANLPEPTISPNADEQADDYFNTVLYTGNGSTQSITGVGFQPDWVWIKQRNAAENHFITDVIRGAGIHLRSDQASAENDDSATFTSFDSDGFSLTGTGPAEPQINDANDTYVSWNWKAGGTAVSNTDGSITSSVSANTDAGFSIVTYTGTGSSATVGHGLGVSPNVIIVKNRIDASDWFVYHSANTSAPETDVLQLNLTDATVDFNSAWNDTLPTSSVFTVGTSNASNGSSDTMVAYCFAEVEGYSKFGSYTGNGSTDGTFVYTGFRPAWVMLKATSQADHWNILDVKRDTFNVMDTRLLANNSTGEQTSSSYNVDFTSNGFKFRTSDVGWNGNAVSYIYMSFAENPFKYSLGR